MIKDAKRRYMLLLASSWCAASREIRCRQLAGRNMRRGFASPRRGIRAGSRSHTVCASLHGALRERVAISERVRVAKGLGGGKRMGGGRTAD